MVRKRLERQVVRDYDRNVESVMEYEVVPTIYGTAQAWGLTMNCAGEVRFFLRSYQRPIDPRRPIR